MISFKDLATVHQKMKLTFEALSLVVQQLSEYGLKKIEEIRKELSHVVDYHMKNPCFIKKIAGCTIACAIGLIACIIYKGKYGEFYDIFISTLYSSNKNI